MAGTSRAQSRGNDLAAKTAEEVAKDQLKEYLLREYGPRPDGDELHDSFINAGSTIGGELGGLVGRIGGRAGKIAGAGAGAVGGAWTANGVYREGQLIKNIFTHPENWTVDAAGAIVPVLPDPNSSNTNGSSSAEAQSSSPPVQTGIGTVGPSLGRPPGS